MPQQIPLCVIPAPPSDAICPPVVATVYFSPLTVSVVRTGRADVVVKVRSLPYPVPAELVA